MNPTIAKKKKDLVALQARYRAKKKEVKSSSEYKKAKRTLASLEDKYERTERLIENLENDITQKYLFQNSKATCRVMTELQPNVSIALRRHLNVNKLRGSDIARFINDLVDVEMNTNKEISAAHKTLDCIDTDKDIADERVQELEKRYERIEARIETLKDQIEEIKQKEIDDKEKRARGVLPRLPNPTREENRTKELEKLNDPKVVKRILADAARLEAAAKL